MPEKSEKKTADFEFFHPHILHMKKNLTRPALTLLAAGAAATGLLLWSGGHETLEASSHREAPLIADDPLADNTDLYAFRSPDAAANDANATVTLIANYIPFELPQGGPNFNTFGENIRYEIHVKNKPVIARAPGDPTSPNDDIIYRFTFDRTNQDPSTFFRIRLGQENLKTTYQLDEIRGAVVTTLVPAGTGIVAPPNVGPRSISARVTVPGVGANVPAGLGNAGGYAAVMQAAVATLGNGIKVFCGPTDDPFFTDLGAIFDLGGVRPAQVQGGGSNAGTARDGLARKNVHTIAMQIPVRLLQATGQNLTTATSILDNNFIIGVWASASRLSLTTRTLTAPFQAASGTYVQVSRIGMPLTNEVVQNVGIKDLWNAEDPIGVPLPAAGTPQFQFDARVMNPELGLYMADNAPVAPAIAKPAGQTYFGEAIAGFAPLRIQSKSLAGTPGLPANGFDFRNGANGLAGLAGNPALNGTALAPLAAGGFGEYLLRPQAAAGQGQPRSVDLLPIFHTGVPNARPYQLATGKAGNPLAAGKPFINNFLPTFGDMLRLNMAVPPTPRNSPDFSSEGLLYAAVLGLTDPRFTASGTALQLIPNMDGFPNGRRLEDDVTRIELQAVSGVVLAAVGLWYDDYPAGGANPVTPRLGQVLGFSTNIEKNDTTFRTAFPYSQLAWSGTTAQQASVLAQRGAAGLGLSANTMVVQAYPNPSTGLMTLHFELGTAANIRIVVSDLTGRKVGTITENRAFKAGAHDLTWNPGREVAPGQYIATVYSGSTVLQSVHIERN